MRREVLSARLNAARSKTPHRVALLAPSRAHTVAWTYQDLSEQVHALSQWISQTLSQQESACGREDIIVGLLFETGVPYVLAALSCLQARVVFMPLDPAWPSPFMEAALKKCTLVLCTDPVQKGISHQIPAPAQSMRLPGRFLMPPSLVGSGRASPAKPSSINNVPDAPQQACTQQDRDTNPGHNVTWSSPERDKQHRDIIYLMWTSGSTGSAKAVCGTATGILNRCDWMERRLPLLEGDVVCFHTAPTFVDSVWQMLGPLLAGATCMVLAPETSRNPTALLQALIAHQASHLVAVPTLLRILLPVMQRLDAKEELVLRMLVSSGEPLSERLLRQLQEVLPAHACILNIYGCTEVSADATCCCLQAQLRGVPGRSSEDGAGTTPLQLARSGPLPVGTPLDNTAVFILPLHDDGGDSPAAQASDGPSDLEIAEHGSVGEVCIAGACVAAGYLGPSPIIAGRTSGQEDGRFGSTPSLVLQSAGSRVQWGASFAWEMPCSVPFFRTGDLGRLGPNGLEILGRMDNEVKIGGVRVNIEEVEACLSCHPAVQAAAVACVDCPTGSQLHAFVELSSNGSSSVPDAHMSRELMQHCKERLTSAALPSRMHCVSQLPESSSGKLQRSRLKELLCEHRVSPSPSGAAVAVTSARPGMGTASGVAPADALGGSGSLSEPEVLPAVAAVEPQSDSLTAEAAVAGLAWPGLEPASEAGVMRAFQASLGAHARGLEPVTDFWAAGGDSRAAMQVAALLGVDVRLLTAFPTARGLARHMQQAAGAMIGQKQSSPAHNGDSASRLRLQDVERTDRPAKSAKRPLLAGLGPSPAAACLPKPKRDKRLKLEPQHADCSSQHLPSSAANPPQCMVQPPNPALGGVVIQRCGQLSYHSASASTDSGQQATPHSPPQHPKIASRPQCVRESANAEPVQSQHTGEPSQGGPSAGHCEGAGRQRKLALLWRVKMNECVDASPLVLMQRQLIEGKVTNRWYTFGCSHGGDVVCVDGHTGATVWKTSVMGRAESGLALTADLTHVVVALFSGDLKFMDTVSGQLRGSVSGCGERPTMPVVDPWDGHIWVASHDCLVTICTSSGEVVDKQHIGEPCSAPVVFHSSCRQAYVAMLRGTVRALTSPNSLGGDTELLWRASAGAPVISAPACLAAQRSLVVATVEGSVRCFGSARGELLWAVELASAVYSPIAAYQPVGGQLQILLGTEKGQLHCLEASSGEERSREQLSVPANSGGPNIVGISTGAAPSVSSERAWTTFEAHGEGRMGDVQCDHISCQEPGRTVGGEGNGRCEHQSEQPSRQGPDALSGGEPSPGTAPSHYASQVWSCTNDGDLVLTAHEGARTVMMAEARISSPIFSSPLAFDNIVLFGCRDDHLYCVRTG